MLSAAALTPTVATLSPDHRHALIAQARTAVLHGGTQTGTEVAPWITRSWQRCLAQGMQPARRVVFEQVSAAAQNRSRDQSHRLVTAARPVLEQLARAIGGMRYFALLTDAHGVVVDVLGALDRQDPRATAIGRIGVDLSEAAVGTTAIGAALAELQPVWLHRGEHFFDDNSSYSCAGAPLFDPQGQCMGMLDLTGIDVPERPELSHLVAHSARAVEDALLLATPHALLLRLNWHGCMLGSDADGLMLLDAEGHIVGCNTAARQLIPQPLHASAQRHCSELLACPWPQLFDAAARQHTAPLDLPLWSGLRLHGMARKASWPSNEEVFPGFGGANSDATSSSARQNHSLPSHPATAPLRAAEAAMIRKAVTDAKGNVAEAARALGISRATVYRKLGAAKRKID